MLYRFRNFVVQCRFRVAYTYGLSVSMIAIEKIYWIQLALNLLEVTNSSLWKILFALLNYMFSDIVCIRSGSRILDFLKWGKADFQKKIPNFVEFFLGRPNWFSELSQITINTPFWPNFLRHRQIKTGQNGVFQAVFEETMTKKSRFFGARSPLKNWHILAPKAPLENFKGTSRKIDISK